MGGLHERFSHECYKDGYFMGLLVVILGCVDHTSHAFGVLENCRGVNGYRLQFSFQGGCE